MKRLIVFYSISCGNTRRVAEMIQKELGADIEELKTEKPYKGDYADIVKQGQREVDYKYKPKVNYSRPRS